MRTELCQKFKSIDLRIAKWMESYGHILHRFSLGVFFIWLGILKTFGVTTATSLIAHVIYWGDPETIIPILGWWEVSIGICLIVRPLVRVSLFLLAVRLPGSVLALILLPEMCFIHVPYEPTIEGQYLLKDVIVFSAALVIGGTVHLEKKVGLYH